MSRSDAGAQPIASYFGLFPRDSARITRGCPALNAEVIDECGQLAIGIYCDMKSFMDQEIVSRSLADDLEIVDISCLVTDLAVECPLRLSGGLVLVTCGKACATDALGLVLELAVITALVVNRRGKQDMKRPSE